MYYPQEIVEEIRRENDIVTVVSSYVNLTRKGNTYFGLCPFHNEHTPSFSVESSKQYYYCFGCGASGNVINFIRNIENLDFIASIKLLAEKINYKLPETVQTEEEIQKQKLIKIIYDIHICAAKFFYNNLVNGVSKDGINYILARDITTNTLTKFGLGYSPKSWDSLYQHLLKSNYAPNDILSSGLVIKSSKTNKIFDRFQNRLMFPIFDVYGKVIGFGGRIIESSKDSKEAKYLNSPDTLIFDKSNNLYGINFARKSQSDTLILVEGYLDTISLHQAGFTNTAAALGTAFNTGHVKLIKKFFDTVILVFDSDEAGIKACKRAIEIVSKTSLNCKVLIIKNAKDPDEFIKKFGATSFEDALLNAKDHISFKIDCLKSSYDLNKPNEKSLFIKQSLDIIKNLNDIDKNIYINDISKITGVDKNVIDSSVTKANIVLASKRSIQIQKTDKNMSHVKNLLSIIANNKKAYMSIKDILNPDELLDEPYVSILKTIYDLHQNNNDTSLASLLDFYDDNQTKTILLDIFNKQLSFDNNNALQKALTDNIKIVKLTYYNKQLIDHKDDVEMLNSIINAKKNIDKLNISLIDG